MPLKDQIANFARKLTEAAPDARKLKAMVYKSAPWTKHFADDGIVPNNPRYPLIIYRRAVHLPKAGFELAVVLDHLFASNGWSRSWRDSIYAFVHYHSQVHEVLGVASGTAAVEFGGIKGKVLKLKAGDVAILPAGTGHRLIQASDDFLVVGAYPRDGDYDECSDSRDRPEAAKRIAKAKKPAADPIFGKRGPLIKLWNSRG